MSVENYFINVSFCGTFQKAVKPKRSEHTSFVVYWTKNVKNPEHYDDVNSDLFLIGAGVCY